MKPFHPDSFHFHPRDRHGHPGFGGRSHHHRGGGRGHGGHNGFGGGAHHAMKRLLAHGDLRFVVLLLIEETPRHGYELIKLIESKSSGQYSPSPGVIYPTLTYLEETGLVTTTLQNDKKQYSITPEGTEHLEQNRDLAKSILQRLEEIGAQLAAAKAEAMNEDADPLDREDIAEIRMIFHSIKRELKASPSRTTKNKKKIVEILERALAEIQAIQNERRS